jgi:adenylylsulfate kinase
MVGEAPPAVIWLTGLSGAGKSTLARWVFEQLRDRGWRVELLDGDAVRDVFPQTGFSKAERDAHVRRVGFLASRLEHHGVTVVASLISPYRESRAFVRGLCRRFVEVHVATPLDVCERRDAKGLYARARNGAITSFTGIDDPYEVPRHPDVIVDTSHATVEEAGRRILEAVDRGRGEEP